MRPIANFTVHAIIAAAIAALATTSAAAQARLTMGNEGVGGSPQAAKSDKPRIAVLEVRSFKWGTLGDTANLGSWAKADGLDVTWDVVEYAPPARGKLQPGGGAGGGGAGQGQWVADVERPAETQGYAPGNTKYSNVKLSRATDQSAAGAGASESITIHGNRTESGLPTGKRQHKPFVLSQPLDQGSVWIRVASPWAACRVGARYPTLELSDGGRTYRLVGATVAGCGRSGAEANRPTEEVAFYYTKISF